MKKGNLFSHLFVPLLVGILLACQTEKSTPPDDPDILSYEVDLQKVALHFFLKDDQGQHFKTFNKLKTWLDNHEQSLEFAMNGGMYKKDLSPQGLYIEKGKVLFPLDTTEKGYGNFYLQPNGIFYLTKDRQGVVCSTTEFKKDTSIRYATQSGPMLIINGAIHPKFNAQSKNIHIRNGVGILPNGHLLFALSKKKVNFHRFASFFKERGCRNALYLDGFVSRAYLPEANWIQEDGTFGVIIGAIKEHH